MKRASAVVCAGILGALAALHFAWAGGSTLFAAGVVPSKAVGVGEDAEPLFDPSRTSTIAVAFALSAGALAVLRAGFTGRGKGLARLVSLAFGARAFGDFRYLGVTKRIKGTEFARRDSRIYAPLCFAVSALAGRAAK